MTNSTDVSKPASSRDKRVKLAFLAVALAAVVVIYLVQRDPLRLKEWQELDAAVPMAQQQGKNLLIAFLGVGESDRQMADGTLLKNSEAISKSGFVRAKQTVNDLSSAVATRYKLKVLPTVMVVSPSGKEILRREGMVGEEEFKAFLKQAQMEAAHK